MSKAASDRGSRLVALDADRKMRAVTARAEAGAHRDELIRLRSRVSRLERDLRRAVRCLAAERAGRERLFQRLIDEDRASSYAISTLCRIAFPDGWPHPDASGDGGGK